MIKREQFNELKTVDSIEAQIKVRQELISQMVGTLYPSILRDEIVLLNERYYAIKYPRLTK